MTRRTPPFVLCSLGALVLLAAPLRAATLHVNPDGVCGGYAPCFADLPGAIAAAAPGDIIYVQAAVYNVPATIVINKPVQIFGPQAGVNPLPSQGTTRTPGAPTEAIFDGGGAIATILSITASGVTLDGLEVRSGTGDLVSSPSGLPLSGTAVRNCIIHGSSGDEGLQLRNQANAVIECNNVFGTAGDGINLCCGSTNGVIRWNEVHDLWSLDAAVYVYNSTGTRIEGNLVYNSANNEGIKLGAKGGPDAALTGGLILGNTIHNTGQDGIALYMSNTTISCNEVYNSASENGAIYLAWATSNNVVENNYVHDNTLNTGKWGNPGGITIGTAVDPTTTTVRNNHLSGNLPNGMTNLAAALLTAQGNWWGDASGPSGAGPGTGDAVSANVDYSSWLTSAPSFSCPPTGTCENPTPTKRQTWGQLKLRYR